MNFIVNGEKKNFEILQSVKLNGEEIAVFHNNETDENGHYKVYVSLKKDDYLTSLDEETFKLITEELKNIMTDENYGDSKLEAINQDVFDGLRLKRGQSFKVTKEQVDAIKNFKLSKEEEEELTFEDSESSFDFEGVPSFEPQKEELPSFKLPKEEPEETPSFEFPKEEPEETPSFDLLKEEELPFEMAKEEKADTNLLEERISALEKENEELKSKINKVIETFKNL